MWPLCSSMRATPLKIITTARRSVQTLIGSNDVFSTKTRAFIPCGYYARAKNKAKGEAPDPAEARLQASSRQPFQITNSKTLNSWRAQSGRGHAPAYVPQVWSLLSELVGRFHQRADVSRLGHGVPGIGRNVQLGLGPGAMKFPRTHHRTNDVVATLHDYPRDVTNLADILDQIIVRVEEGVVHEVMAFDAREGQGELRVGKLFDGFVIKEKF